MCFIKKPSIPAPVAVPQQVEPEPVERHQADASKTKFSTNEVNQGYRENIRTSVIGLTDEAKIDKKTLLGE